MTELRELFEKTVEKLRATECPDEINETLAEFEAELPEGKIKELFFNLGKEMDLPAGEELKTMGIEERKRVLDQLLEQMKTELGKAPQEIPTEITKAYEKMLDRLNLQIKTLNKDTS